MDANASTINNNQEEKLAVFAPQKKLNGVQPYDFCEQLAPQFLKVRIWI